MNYKDLEYPSPNVETKDGVSTYEEYLKFVKEYYSHKYFDGTYTSTNYVGGYGGSWYIAPTKWVSEIFQHASGKRLLDVGCAVGAYCNEFKKLGYNCYGIDPSEDAIKVAKENLGEGSFKVGFIEDIPFEDEFFDIYTTFEVAEHSHSTLNEKIASEAFRVLKSGGMMYFQAQICNSKESISKSYKAVNIDKGHLNIQTYEFWISIFTEFGFLYDFNSMILLEKTKPNEILKYGWQYLVFKKP